MEVHNKTKVTLGICAMEKKVTSKHMQMILDGLKKFEEFTLFIFTEYIIFEEEIEKWPRVEAMIVFFSNGFPYNKVLQYINLTNPFLINDFEMQKVFWDRRRVIQMLKANNLPTPNQILIDRGEEINNDVSKTSIELNTSQEVREMIKKYNVDYGHKENITVNSNTNSPGKSSDDDDSDSKKSDYDYIVDFADEKDNELFSLSDENDLDELKEYEDYIEYNGKKIHKPFVEKPCNGDDHNIAIYYPVSHGGGMKRLFRKTDNLCSLYYPDKNKIRKDKSYIYEEFLQTDGFDIKVYTIGPEYFHAEARKSPTLDGKVQRTKDGKEMRYPINLTPEEKEYARKIVLIFKQNVCGFDILRARGQSYVCDVNGWSFVKGNKKYYEDCAILIRKIVLQKINMKLYLENPIKLNKIPIYQGMTLPRNSDRRIDEELRSVVAVFRHADRSPKQKTKVVVTDPSILSLFERFESKAIYCNKNIHNEPKEIKLKNPKDLTIVLQIVKNYLVSKEIDETNLSDINDSLYLKLYQVKMVLEKNLSLEGLTRKIQLRPLKWEKDPNSNKYKITQAMIIMKWGGNITHAGIEQGKLLGNTFRREMYPSNPGDGDDLLRLHATYRHDLKCYSSEEDRCLETAAAFLQGLLQLDGHLIPIISSMVRRDDLINRFLDVSCTEIETMRKTVKGELTDICNSDSSLKDGYYSLLNRPPPEKNNRRPIDDLMDKIVNFYPQMEKAYILMEAIIDDLKTMLSTDEVEKECSSCFIHSSTSLDARWESSQIEEDTKVKTKMSSKDNNQTVKGSAHPSLSIPKQENKNLSTSFTNLSNASMATTKQPVLDCEDEKIVLIFKRYTKLHRDFYDKETKKFDISKIPDIYDNIKYDLLHNKHILPNDKANELYGLINLLANFVMPLEYGIRTEEKVKIGLKIISPLLDKIRRDLIWWNMDNAECSIKHTLSQNYELEHMERSYSGLDQERLNTNDIKTSWRHVKTRFYCTSASHLYSLVNTLVYGFGSFLVNDLKKMHNPLRNVFDLDYCSHIVFRLFENFNVEVTNPKRFRIEIIMSPGTNKDPNEADKNHTLPVAPWIILNNNLTLDDMKKYFDFCLKDQ